MPASQGCCDDSETLCEDSQEITVLCENAKASVFLLLWDKEVIIPLDINFAMGICPDLDSFFTLY